MRFHDLRHTAATLAIARGVPIKAVSEMLGHADITTTLRIYAHVIPSMHQAAADIMDDILGE
jgi:integrase